MDPRITIAVPTLNQALFIEQAIDSLLSQNYSRLNIIVLDGGSSDGTIQILKRYEKYIHYFRSWPDSGPWPSILEAANLVESGWFNWLNSDDYLLPGALASLAELIAMAPHSSWVSGARLDVDADGRVMRSICPWLDNACEIPYGDPFLPQDATFFDVDFFRICSQRVPAGLTRIFDTVLNSIAWQEKRPLLTDCVFSAMRWYPGQLTSNEQKRAQERARKDVKQLCQSGSFMLKTLARLSRTRLRPEVSALTRYLLSRGYFGSNTTSTCMYNSYKYRRTICSVADVYCS